MFRYNAPDDFGEPENAFNICTFWYIDALASIGRSEEALALAVELGDPALERAALVTLGDVDLVTGDGATAANHYSAALLIDESTGAHSRIAQDLVGRGGAYSLLGRDDEARSDLHRAAEMFREAGQESARWVAWLNLADSFEESEPDSAAWYYDAALASLEHGNDAVGGEAMNTGYLFSDRGRAYEEITRYYATRHRAYPEQGWDAKVNNEIGHSCCQVGFSTAIRTL